MNYKKEMINNTISKFWLNKNKNIKYKIFINLNNNKYDKRIKINLQDLYYIKIQKSCLKKIFKKNY